MALQNKMWRAWLQPAAALCARSQLSISNVLPTHSSSTSRLLATLHRSLNIGSASPGTLPHPAWGSAPCFTMPTMSSAWSCLSWGSSTGLPQLTALPNTKSSSADPALLCEGQSRVKEVLHAYKAAPDLPPAFQGQQKALSMMHVSPQPWGPALGVKFTLERSVPCVWKGCSWTSSSPSAGSSRPSGRSPWGHG